VLGLTSFTDWQTIEYVASDKLSCFEMCLIRDNCTMVSFNKKHQNDCLLRMSSKNANFSRTQQFPVIKFESLVIYFYNVNLRFLIKIESCLFRYNLRKFKSNF
jgi:hypothetical protein